MQIAEMSDMNKKLFALVLTEICSSTLDYHPGLKHSKNPNTNQEINNLPVQIILPSPVCDRVEGLSWG